MHIETTSVCFQKEKDNLVKCITLLVIVFHGIFLSLTLYFQADMSNVKRQHQKLIVQTISLKPVQNTSVANFVNKEETEIAEIAIMPKIEESKEILNEIIETKVEPIKKVEQAKVEPIKKIEQKKIIPKKVLPKKVEPVKKVEPLKKTESIKKIEPEKKTKPLNKVEAKKPVDKIAEEAHAKNAKQKELLAIAQQNLAKIDKVKVSKVNSQKTILPEQIGALNVDAVVSTENSGSLNVREIGYRDELGARLKTLLKLPEHGEVKIKLSLDKTGKFIRVEIVNAESDKNKKYIENTIKTLTFPSFQGAFQNLPEYTFSITLK